MSRWRMCSLSSQRSLAVKICLVDSDWKYVLDACIATAFQTGAGQRLPYEMQIIRTS